MFSGCVVKRTDARRLSSSAQAKNSRKERADLSKTATATVSGPSGTAACSQRSRHGARYWRVAQVWKVMESAGMQRRGEISGPGRRRT